uniref:Protein SHQ1 homolog n=1 Tax=Trichuris muris TaxID=70415 RepID=A0A5S6QKU1_TRIMR
MYTPVFCVDQDEDCLIVCVKAPYARPSEVDVFFSRTEFLFYCPPYFLRLFLPREVVECYGECTSFDPENNVFTIRAPKRNVGEHFPDLNMLTRLLVPEGSPAVDTCNVKMPGEAPNPESRVIQLEQLYFKQKMPVDFAEAAIEYRYGFASSRHHVFLHFQEASDQLIDIDNPDKYTITRRRLILRGKEDDKFCEDAYLADLHNEDVGDLLTLRQPWRVRITGEGCFMGGQFNVDEIERLKSLPKKNVTLIPEAERCALFSLLDILYGFAYDCRINCGDDCVESGWNIRKLSSTLSGLVTWNDVRSPIVASVRRSLCYPLIRNFEFSTRVILDVAEMLLAGKVQLIKCLLCIHRIFANTGDFVYLFNDLYITDYCVWLQGLREDVLVDLGREVSRLEISKEELGFDLPLLDACARLALEESHVDQRQQAAPEKVSLSEFLRTMLTKSNEVAGSESEDESTTESVCSLENKVKDLLIN